MTRFAQQTWRKVLRTSLLEADDSSLASSWSLANDLKDSIGGNDGTKVGPVTVGSPSIIGSGVRLCGNCYVDVGNDASLRTTSQTISVWLVQVNQATPSTLQGVYTDGSTGLALRYLAINNGEPQFAAGNGGIGGSGLARANATIPTGKLVHLVGVMDFDGSGTTTLRLYVDGVLTPTQDTFNGQVSYSGSSDRIGYLNSIRYFNGNIYHVKVYNEAKDQAWVTKEYLKGARSIQFATDWGHRADGLGYTTPAAIGDGPFYIQQSTGTPQTISCSNSTINGTSVKTIKNLAGESFALKHSHVGLVGSETGYGSWSFWAKVLPSAGISIVVHFISSTPNPLSTAGSVGYHLRIAGPDTSNLVQLTRTGVANLLSANVADTAAWHHYHITRQSLTGKFEIFQDGISLGTATENTVVSGKYLAVYSRLDCEIALCDAHGGHALTKYVGVVPPQLG